jgi:hypothetical protein
MSEVQTNQPGDPLEGYRSMTACLEREIDRLEAECRRLREEFAALYQEIRSRFSKSEKGFDDMTPDLRKIMLQARAALTPPEAQPGALVELPMTPGERREIAGILGVPETQIHKLDMQRGGKA